MKALYDSPLVVTLLPCIVALLVFAFAQTKVGLVRSYGSIFSIGIAADAFLNGPWSPVKAGALSTGFGVFFVIFGDFRYFVVLEQSMHSTQKWLRAAAWAFAVPVASQIVRWRVPSIAADERSTFLLYEILFFVLAGAIRAFRVPHARDVALARRATDFVLVQYALWMLADIGLILTSRDVFYAPRLGANIFYYVLFVPVMMIWLERSRAKRASA